MSAPDVGTCNYHMGRRIHDGATPFAYTFSEGGRSYTANLCSAECLDAMYRDKREAIVKARLNKAGMGRP